MTLPCYNSKYMMLTLSLINASVNWSCFVAFWAKFDPKTCSQDKILVSECIFKLVFVFVRDVVDEIYFVVCENCWKVLEESFDVAYLNVILFTKHEKDTATEAYIKPSKISIMEFFNWFSVLNYFYSLSILQKSHHIFLIWLKYASGLFDITIQMSIEHFISCIRHSS